MALQRRRINQVIPDYSLTGDLLSFLRCGLQYRYHNGSALPPSRPVQLWFGEFIHGIMEGAFRIWRDTTPKLTFPWPMTITPYSATADPSRARHDIGVIGDTVEATLRAQGKIPRSSAVRESAYRRAEKAVNELGPDLFPLIAAAEEMVIGTRTIPPMHGGNARASLYELHGIIDVVTDMELSGVSPLNGFRRAIEEAIPGLAGRFEVIVDYKGASRPSTNHAYWAQGGWQVQTYAWLRTQQAQSLPVVAGILVYINELAPTSEDLNALRQQMAQGNTDVSPQRGSPDYYKLNAWRPGAAIPDFSFEFRFSRAIRVIPVNGVSQTAATDEFDRVVQDIERCVEDEAVNGNIIGRWPARGDEETCVACDFRHFCPSPYPRSGAHQITAPHAP